MRIRIRETVGSRRAILSLVGMLAVAGLMWFSMMHGVGIASADGGPDAGAQQNNVGQQYEEPAFVNTCLFPGIPC